MDCWQFERQIKYLLDTATWPDSPNEKVFSSVHVTAGSAQEIDGILRFPCVLIRPLDADTDPQAPSLVRNRHEVTVIAANASDPLGESSMIGGNRSAGQGSSKGRGLLELETQFLSAVSSSDQTSAMRLREVRRSASEAAFHPSLGYVVARSFTLETIGSISRSYDVAFRLKATAPGSGNVSLTWANPPSRFDFNSSTIPSVGPRGGLVLRYQAGATAPSTPTAGTGVTVAFGATSVTTNTGVGQFSFALWGGFDETGSATNERFSDTAATVTITAT